MPRRMDVKNKKVKLCSSYAPHGMDDIFNLFNLISAHGHVGQWLKIKIKNLFTSPMPRRMDVKNKKVKLCLFKVPRGMVNILK